MQAQEMQQMNSEKDWVVTLILSILVGGLGIDRFYSGSILLGVLKLFTLGGLGLWWLIDLIMLVTGSYKDGNGNPIVSKWYSNRLPSETMGVARVTLHLQTTTIQRRISCSAYPVKASTHRTYRR